MSVTSAYRRPAPAMQTSYGSSNQQMRGIAPTASQSTSTLTRPQPVAMAHPSQRYKRSSANPYSYKIEFNGTKADGRPREVIVIDDDTPEPSADSRGSTAKAGPSIPPSNQNSYNTTKRRRPNNNNNNSSSAVAPASNQPAGYANHQAYAPYTEPRSYYASESSRKVAPSGVGGKRKAADSSSTSKVCPYSTLTSAHLCSPL